MQSFVRYCERNGWLNRDPLKGIERKREPRDETRAIAYDDLEALWTRSDVDLRVLKHLADVEDHWSHRGIAGRDRPDPLEDIDWAADQDWEWNSANDDTPAELFEFWERSVARSQRIIDTALASGGLDQPGSRTSPDGRSPSIRWSLVHLIEEYARHNGHADLLSEAVDGATGE